MTTSRLCPLCSTDRRETLYRYTTTFAGEQELFACSCGMIYSSGGTAVDYGADSIYATPQALGSGVTKRDAIRLADTACAIERMIPASKDTAILDYGCGQGGLLDALRDRGYTNLTGFDLSPHCTNVTAAKGHKILPSISEEKYDLITFSHVLEHIPEPQVLLRYLLQRLAPAGHLYVEVPDAQRYSLPFLDFNSEHINHLDACSLKRLLESCGLFGGTVQEKTFQLNNGSSYPAIWTLTRRSRTVINMAKFIESSHAALARAKARMDAELGESSDVIVWGAGEYLAHVMPLLEERNIAQIVDSNPALRGRIAFGHAVRAPLEIREGLPIIITALVAAPAIKLQIEAMQLKNRVIELRFE